MRPLYALQELRRLQIRTTRAVDSFLAGAYKTAFKGEGVEFAEVRLYQPGDDIRSIDWNATARSGRTYIKHFHEERELTVMLIVDISASSFFGSKPKMLAEIGALITFCAQQNGDKVGLILFSSEVELYLPPRGSMGHAMQIVRALFTHKPRRKKTDIEKALAFFSRMQKRSCLCFLLSDFLAPLPSTMPVVAKRYDLIALRIQDRHEVKLPRRGVLRVRDLESNQELVVDTLHPLVRKNFHQKIKERSKSLSSFTSRLTIDYLEIQGENYARDLQRFLLTRGRRV